MAKANRRAKHTNASEHSSLSSSSTTTATTATPSSVADDNQHQQHDYEKQVHDLEQKNEAYQKEIEELRKKLVDRSVTPNDTVKKLKEGYLQKLNALEEQVKELKKKQDIQSQLSTYRRKKEEGTTYLQDEIQKLKAQKVQLQCKIKLDAVQFRLCKASLEKEILQLKKLARRNEYEMQQLLSMNQRQKMVLHRKMEESSTASNRLKQLVESRKALLCRKAGFRKGNAIALQAIEHDLEVTAHISEICSEYEHQITMLADEITKIKEESEMLKQENLRLLLENKELECREDPELKNLKDEVVRMSCTLSKLEMQKIKFPSLEETQDNLSQPSPSIGSTNEYSNTSTQEVEKGDEGNASKKEQALGPCCSCSKKSLCKTSKCACRAAGGSCGTSCGCSHTKCTNRDVLPIKLKESVQTELVEGNSSCSGIAEIEKISIPDTKEAVPPLTTAASEPTGVNDNCGLKKMPLYDIANTLMKTFGPKHNQRRKERN